MKLVFVTPVVVILSAVLGYGVLRVSGWPTFPHEMIAAVIPSVIAGAIGVVPVLLQRANGQAAVVQAAFQGMIVHMGATLGLAVLVFILAGPHHLAVQPFALWMLWFFFVALSAVSATLIWAIRSTPVAPATRV
ncbi:MAG TPA: hypothetical protein VFE47_07165 [Tepidisphaeraceae bacterium]|jgi:hypothetical protein|nr:hypothetical protein [Tepidisphaeraceae bacterium]